MARTIELRFLRIGSIFAIGARTAAVLASNEGEVKVKILTGDDAGKTIGWALGTEIDRILPGRYDPDEQKAEDPTGEATSHTCDVCGKTCTSRSGLTLHKKSAHY